MFEDDFEEMEDLDRGDNFESEEDQVDDEDQEDQEEEDQEDELEDTEEEEVEEEEEEPVQPKKEPKIPKGRLDKALRQRDEARERSLWLEEQLEKLINQQTTTKSSQPATPTEPDFDFDKAENDYADLLIQGEVAQAARLRQTIDRERTKEIQKLIEGVKSSAIDEASKKSSADIEEAKFKTLVKSYEQKYDFFDSEHDNYNEEAIDTVNALMSGYLNKGMTKSAALKQAVDKVLPLYAKETTKAGKSLGQSRKEEAGRKAAKASQAQPSKTKSTSSTKIDTSKLDIRKMSEKDFDKLTPRELALLRGD